VLRTAVPAWAARSHPTTSSSTPSDEASATRCGIEPVPKDPAGRSRAVGSTPAGRAGRGRDPGEHPEVEVGEAIGIVDLAEATLDAEAAGGRA
jgi:hypothetical protein